MRHNILNDTYFLNNFKFTNLSNCVYLIEKKFTNNYDRETTSMSCPIPVEFLKDRKRLHFENFLNNFIEIFKNENNARVFTLYEYRDFKERYDCNEYLNLHFSAIFYSEITESNTVFKMSVTINLENGTVDRYHIGNLPTYTDTFSRFVFDDLEILKNNMTTQFLEKIYLKYVES